MEIRKCDSSYKGISVPFSYETDEYYDLEIKENQFTFIKKKCDVPMKKGFDFHLLEDWNEDPVLYGIFEEEKMIGFIEINKEWNQRLRIVNLYVQKEYRRHHLGSQLMKIAFHEATQQNCRAVVLETQSCNTKAISFYQAMGFEIIGFDTLCYSNSDIENKEIRIEMARKCSNHCE